MPRSTAYVKPSTIRSLSWLIGLIGIVAAIAGPVYAINGATQAPGTVRVPVELAVEAEPSAGGPGDGRIPLEVAELPDGAAVSALNTGRELELAAWDSTVVEQLLGRGDAAVFGLAVGVGAWLLRPVLDSLAAGRPFGAGNARRLAGLAGAVVVAGSVGPVLPQLGSLAVLDRLGLVGPGSPFVMGLTLASTPALLVGALLLVLAEAFRQGERISRDVEGLV
jgi:Protein of unknown function (DUF2975)